MADKVTTMVMKVDLQCPRCYRKIKKVLCKFPEIRDQMYDEKQNKVTIAVVTCCPEVIRKRICSKGGRSVESIEIVPEKKEETKKKEGDKDKPKDAAGEKKKDPSDEKAKQAAAEKKPEAQVHKDVFEPVSGFPTIHPSGVFYNNQPYYPGYGGVPVPMPCHHGHGRPCMCYGGPACQGYGGNRGGYNSTGRFDYFSEENAEACSIM